MLTPQLTSALEELVDEIDRLSLVGEQRRQERGAQGLSTETLRYARAGVVQAATGAAAPETLREVTRALTDGCAEDAPLAVRARRVDQLLG